MFSLSTIANSGTRAARQFQALHWRVIIRSRQQQQHRLLSLLIKTSSRPSPLLPSANATSSFDTDPSQNFSTKIDHVVDGVMKKEFPGYVEKDHDRHGAPQAPVLDFHERTLKKAKRSVAEDESRDPVDHDRDFYALPSFCKGRPRKLTNHEVAKVVERHHSVDECLVVDIDVKEMHAGEVPVAFVVTKSDALKYIDPDNKIHDTLLTSVKAVLGSYSENHQELTRDVVHKLDELLLHDKSIRQDMIRDEIVQCLRDEYGPCTLVKVVFIDAIPRTASGKAMRGTLYKLAKGEPFTITKLILDHEALRMIEKEIKILVGADDTISTAQRPQEANSA